MKAGLAVFVKTRGISPIKTRLSADIGKERAEHFYMLSCDSISETFFDSTYVQMYWAVADKGIDLDDWARFPRLYQGEGSLGERLDQVYRQLLKQYQKVLLIGADAPQLSQDIVLEAIKSLDDFDYIIGPAVDGGFYLFAGKKPIPSKVWQDTPYSVSQTAQVLIQQLKLQGSLKLLPAMRDVDNINDLRYLQKHREQLLVAPQFKQLKSWLEQQELI